MVLLSQRLQLDPFQASELNLLHNLFADPFIRKYLWDDEIISIDIAGDILQKSQSYFSESGWGLWKISRKKDLIVVGFCGLWHFFDEDQPQLIYGLVEEQTGKGYATEAAKLLVDYTHKQLHFQYLVAAMDKPHLASQKIAARIGMRRWKDQVIDGKETVFYRIDF